MQLTLKTLALTASLALLGQALLAQDTAAPAAEPPAPPTLETAQVGETYLAEVSDPWELRCIKLETGQGPCQLFQALKDEAGTNVAEFNIFLLPEGSEAVAGGIVVSPLETLLEAGVAIQIDGGAASFYPFVLCNAYGCIAQPGFLAEDVAALKAGNSAKVTVVPALAPDQKVTLNMSLMGFTAMLDKTKRSE